jgi:hypothetical protein
MRSRPWVAVLALCLVAGCADTDETPPLPTTPAGVFGPDLILQDFGSFGASRTSVVASGDPRFPAALRVAYPAGSASLQARRDTGAPEGGAQYYLRWAHGPADEAYLRYFVRFPAGFAFVKGGKLPGLYGGRVNSGKEIPDGTDGFSTRYMWRGGGLGEVYAYLPTSKEHGTSLGRGTWSWPTGNWVSVQQRVRLNAPGRDDGALRVWINGAQVLDLGGLDFRTTGDLRIDGLFFSTFFGGDDASWASPTDQYADFAGFTISDHLVAEE